MRLIDSLANIGLPRYLSAEEFLHVMDDNEVEAAIVSATPACADLGELSRAALRYGDRLRVVGTVFGGSASERKDCVLAQINAGFAGVHLPEEVVAEEPDLLDLIGNTGTVPFVTSPSGLQLAARALASYLERFPQAIVCSPGFGGVAEPEALQIETVARLFSHPRFFVIFSGQGAYEREPLKKWAKAVVQAIGWSRVLWGSDFPQCLWRGESYISTTVWVDKIGLDPSADERDLFFWRNTRRVLFDRGQTHPQPLVIRWCQTLQPDRALRVSLFPNSPIDLPEGAQHALLAAYLNRSGPGSYRDFVAEQLTDAARRLGTGEKR
ncbi:MAG TPA: amidohydrolase family protein [Capsulimonadaceae bacterium]|nr:amidohydrolase family protein [Capsulimonadaceae bacterium]